MVFLQAKDTIFWIPPHNFLSLAKRAKAKRSILLHTSPVSNNMEVISDTEHEQENNNT